MQRDKLSTLHGHLPDSRRGGGSHFNALNCTRVESVDQAHDEALVEWLIIEIAMKRRAALDGLANPTPMVYHYGR